MRPKNIGIGLAHSQLRGDQKLTERDNIAYLVHSRVTKQRASEQVQALRGCTGSRPDDPGDLQRRRQPRGLLLRGTAEARSRGHADTRTPSGGLGARQPLAEIAIYRDVSKAVIPCGTGDPPR
jgi:hypothetical protein